MAIAETARLIASIELQDKISPQLGKINASLGKLERNTSVTGRALGTALGTGLERLAEKGIGVLVGAVQSGEANLHILQESIGQTQAIIESTGGVAGVTATQVRDLAESLETLTTVDDKAVQAGENVLLRYTGIGKDIFPQATKAATDLAVAFAKGDAANADVAQSAAQIGKALQDPIKGLTSLRKAGVVFTEQEQDQIKALVKAGDTMGAQQSILKALETRYGKAGEAAGKTGAAGVRRLNDAVEDAQIALATGLSPALDDIRAELTKGLSDPGTQQDLRNLGVFLGDAAKSGLAFAKSIPWQQVGEGLKTAAGFAGKLIDVFAHLPPGVQGTIIGLAALKKLGGGGVIKIGVDLLGEGVKGILGQFVSRGSPANPMFVVAEGGGLGGTAVPGATTGGLSGLSKLFLVGEAIGLIAAVNAVRETIAGELTQQAKGIHDAVSTQINDSKTTAGQLAQSLAGVNQGIEKLSHDPIGNALLGDQLGELQQIRAELGSALKAQDDTNKANFRQGERDDAAKAKQQKDAIDRARDKIETMRIALASKVQSTTSKVGDIQRTTATSTANAADRIVAAINNKDLSVTVQAFVDVGDAGNRTTTLHTTAGLTGGGARRR